MPTIVNATPATLRIAHPMSDLPIQQAIKASNTKALEQALGTELTKQELDHARALLRTSRPTQNSVASKYKTADQVATPFQLKLIARLIRLEKLDPQGDILGKTTGDKPCVSANHVLERLKKFAGYVNDPANMFEKSEGGSEKEYRSALDSFSFYLRSAADVLKAYSAKNFSQGQCFLYYPPSC